ncbi:hypothetical protein Ciccas_001840 [Cichlidogyrus casuarinus]|uniref:Phospholipid-transporting ATPase n=1 Tax=Cichlidogyrus casuarinus TaxID=1844966 RepID=A0ABD2QJ50_9PLAT
MLELIAMQGECPLGVEHTMWANTVLAAGSAIGLVVYTGSETRAVMNSSKPRSKLARLDRELSNINKLLIACVVVLAFVMVALKGFVGPWFLYYWRFFLLFSYIIPLALRVNMDLAKIVYALLIGRDDALKGAVVRNSTIPEDLGRIAFLMSDKTGTLTQNEMVFRKLHLGTVSYTHESLSEIRGFLQQQQEPSTQAGQQVKKSAADKVYDAVLALALCHNVTPMEGEEGGYQASSPDEVALVNWTASVGMRLVARDRESMTLRLEGGQERHFDILQDFPFTSESKRMGIVVQERETGLITFYVKGADSTIAQMVKHTPWLDDEVGNLAREGLRTLVVASKPLTSDQWKQFAQQLHQAKMATVDRQLKVDAALAALHKDLDTLCLTGVEDKLQEDVRLSLETLRNAGVRVWMLTGDKLETAQCIAKSSRLVSKTQELYTFHGVSTRNEALYELNAFRRRNQAALVITGASLMVCVEYHEAEFMDLVQHCPAVVVCRCTPTQKSHVVRLMRRYTGKIVAAIGDGGNDVGMIQAADVGLGLEGKEGKQASLASDYSLVQFRQVTRLLLVHGRDCYKNSCALSQFVMHRGIVISVMQARPDPDQINVRVFGVARPSLGPGGPAKVSLHRILSLQSRITEPQLSSTFGKPVAGAVFSAVYFFVAIQLFPGLLMVGYATIFTMFPVFSLVLDKDVSPDVAMRFPELYKDMAKGRELCFKTFFVWALISTYQGVVIMYGALILFEDEFIHLLAITFTSLVLTELLMVALTVRTWHWLMVVAELLSLVIYIVALAVLKEYFDPSFLQTGTFMWKTAAITAVSCIPLIVLKIVRLWLTPSVYSRLQH